MQTVQVADDGRGRVGGQTLGLHTLPTRSQAALLMVLGPGRKLYCSLRGIIQLSLGSPRPLDETDDENHGCVKTSPRASNGHFTRWTEVSVQQH